MKIIDISHVIDNDTPIYPGGYKTMLSKYRSIEKDYYNSCLLQTCLHVGTHIDIPMHLINDERTMVDFPVDRFIGRGVLLDVRGENTIMMKPEYENIILKGNIVLLYTGFDKCYRENKYFTEHPTVDDEFSKFLLSKNIKMLGMDMPAPDYPPFKTHKNLLSGGIFILENLTNLQNMVGIEKFEVIALPLKISAEASLVRAVCKI